MERALAVDGGDEYYLKWYLDRRSGIARSHRGHRVRMRPFMDVIGCAPAVTAPVSTHPPRRTGGNIECKELVAGGSLYLPIEVPGALVSVGDGHAAQGDGESGVTAIECPMSEVRLTLTIHQDDGMPAPYARSPDAWIAFGFDESLDLAAEQALSRAVSIIQLKGGMARREALTIASQIVDLRITQIVNGVQGVHAVVTHDALALARHAAQV